MKGPIELGSVRLRDGHVEISVSVWCGACKRAHWAVTRMPIDALARPDCSAETGEAPMSGWIVQWIADGVAASRYFAAVEDADAFVAKMKAQGRVAAKASAVGGPAAVDDLPRPLRRVKR